MATYKASHKMDTFVSARSPDTNWGTSPNISVGGETGTDQMRGLILYTLPDFDPAIVINSAKMYLNHYVNSYSPPDPITVDVHNVLGSWDEEAVTWNNQPSHDSVVVASITKSPSKFDWWVIDITDLVKDWISGSKSNYGVKLIAPAASTGTVGFASKENTLYTKSYLLIDYTRIGTELTLSADKSSVPVGSTVRLYGQLTRSDTGLGLSGETVKLQQLIDSTWTDIDSVTTNPDGTFEFNVTFNDIGDFSFRVVYVQTLNFAGSISPTVTITVTKISTDITLVVDKNSIFPGQTVNFSGYLTRSDTLEGISGETVYLQQQIDTVWTDIQSKTTGVGGSFNFSVILSEVGSFNYRVRYPSSDIYDPAASSSQTITVNKFPTSLTLSPDKFQTVVDSIINFLGSLTNTETGEGIGGQVVKLQQLVDTTWTDILSGTTEADGSVTLSRTMGIVGDLAFRLVFDGSDLYEPSTSNTVTITVTKIPTSLTFSADKTRVNVGELIHLFGSLIRADTGDPITGQPIDLQQLIDSTWTTVQTATTTADGSFDFPISFSAEGTFSFKSVFEGSEKHEPTESASIDITSVMPTVSTILTMVANTKTSRVGESITFSGELKTEDLEAIADAEIKLQQQSGTEWVDVGSGKTNTNGFYSITKTFTEAGTFTFRTAFLGAEPYGPSHSSPEAITVLSAVPYKRAPSRIVARLDVDKTEVSVGTPIKLWGNLTFIAPLRAIPIPFQGISIYKDKQVIAHSITNIRGSFELVWTPKEVGTYDIYTEAHTRLLGLKLTESNHVIINVSYTASPPPSSYTLTVSVSTGGTTDPAPGTYAYTEGTSVNVTAIPDSGYIFDHWILDGATRTENPITILMDSDHTLTAYFTTAPVEHTLTVETTVGGTTDPAPGSYTYTEGTSVTVTAVPDSGYEFDHWELDGINVGSVNPYTVTMNADYILKAVFVAPGGPTPR